MNMRSKVAAVTGAGSGIGAATVYALAEAGCTVWAADCDREAAEIVAGDRRVARAWGMARAIRCDVTNTYETEQLAETIRCQNGKLDIVVNNAGIQYPGSLGKMPEEMMQEIISVNFGGVCNIYRSVRELMIESGRGGRIVNVSSTQAFGVDGPPSVYQGTKAGVIGLTRSMAIEMAPHGILVNCVAPGAIATWGMGKLDDEGRRHLPDYRRSIPLNRRGNPEEVANVIRFFCSPESSYVTGAVIVVDGGFSIEFTPSGVVQQRPLSPEDPDG